MEAGGLDRATGWGRPTLPGEPWLPNLDGAF
jgi:hypothetical protein